MEKSMQYVLQYKFLSIKSFMIENFIINNQFISVMPRSKQSRLSYSKSDHTQYTLDYADSLNSIVSSLSQVKKQSSNIKADFQAFRQQTFQHIGTWVKQISAFIYRQIKQRYYFEQQAQKSRALQQGMKGQVIKLKDMIQSAVEDYEKQLLAKDQIIKEKDQQIMVLISKLRGDQRALDKDSSIRIEQSRLSQGKSLEIIQQQSQQATYSSAASLRDPAQQKNYDTMEQKLLLPQTLILTAQINFNYPTVNLSEASSSQQSPQPRNDHKRTKSFIDHFRRTIGESLSQKNQEQIEQNSVYYRQKAPQPLKQISLNEKSFKKANTPINCGKKQEYNWVKNQTDYKVYKAPKETTKQTQSWKSSCQISKSSSSSELIIGNQAQRICIPKKFQIPQHMAFFRKKQSAQRIQTEPSPERIERPDSFVSSKPQHSHKRIFHEKKSSCEKSRSNHSNQDSRSIKSSLSKEKIKVTSKMIDELGHAVKKSSSKAFVYLGGKSIFRKFLLELKAAFRKYNISIAPQQQEVRYEGGRRNGMRWGTGRVIYHNGTVYEGQFKQNMRQGRGSIFINGISIYQGLWQNDRIHGEGYIKSLRCMTNNCPSVFSEASYCGNLYENKLHGIGTIFLNPKQKIVTKFSGGVPTGQLTYYNLQEIEFGVWPSD